MALLNVAAIETFLTRLHDATNEMPSAFNFWSRPWISIPTDSIVWREPSAVSRTMKKIVELGTNCGRKFSAFRGAKMFPVPKTALPESSSRCLKFLKRLCFSRKCCTPASRSKTSSGMSEFAQQRRQVGFASRQLVDGMARVQKPSPDKRNAKCLSFFSAFPPGMFLPCK